MGIFTISSKKLVCDASETQAKEKALGMQENVQRAATQAAADAAVNSAGKEIRNRFGSKSKYITLVRTAVGVLAVIGVWGAALANLPSTTVIVGVYLLIIAVPITLLELSFLFTKLTFCANEEGRIGKLRRMLNVVDSWKRGVVYAVLAIIAFIPMPFPSIFATLFGICLLALSILYCAKAFQPAEEPRGAEYEAAPGSGGKLEDPAQYGGNYSQVP